VTDSSLQPQDRVRHPLAGMGTVLSVKGTTAQVSWDAGGQGVAYLRDLVVVR
jgi:hypothetical protein